LELIIIWEDEENTYKYNQMILCRGLQSIMLYLKLTRVLDLTEEWSNYYLQHECILFLLIFLWFIYQNVSNS
jgi:hypothetical protein